MYMCIYVKVLAADRGNTMKQKSDMGKYSLQFRIEIGSLILTLKFQFDTKTV